MDLKLPPGRAFLGPAPLHRRFLAFLLDILVLDLVVFTPFAPLLEGATFGTAFELGVAALAMIIAGFLALLYFSVLEYWTGQTLGKVVMRIRVAPLRKDVGFFSYLLRSMWFILVFPFVLLWIIDPLYLLFTNRRLSEQLSRTQTVSTYVI